MCGVICHVVCSEQSTGDAERSALRQPIQAHEQEGAAGGVSNGGAALTSRMTRRRKILLMLGDIFDGLPTPTQFS